MAKQTIGEIFKRTEPAVQEEKTAKLTKKPLSVYLTLEEKARLEEIAQEIGQSKHAIMQFSIREFLRRYDAGEYEIQTEKVIKKSLKAL